MPNGKWGRALISSPLDLDLQMGPSAIPNEIPVKTGYLMRICETLHSTPAIGRAIVIATTLSVCVCVRYVE